jgi:uncharacterized protein
MPDTKQVTISSIYYYPVKSMRGIPQSEAIINGEGINGDRRWMLIDSNGQFISQRHMPELAKISVIVTHSHLELTHADHQKILLLPLDPDGDFVADNVAIWDDNIANVLGYSCSQDWLKLTLGEFRGKALTLVKMPAVSEREVEPNLIGPKRAFTGFADGYPFLVTNQSSLELLNSQLQKSKCSPVDMGRFRPNIVIDGLNAFEEELGGRLQFANGAELELVKPCQRCQMITQDQRSGAVREVGQPTKSLFKVQSIDPKRGAFFGQNAILNLEHFNDVSHTSDRPPLTMKVGQKLLWLPNS